MAPITNAISRAAIHGGDRQLRRTCARFGDEFREIRLRAGVSQAAVARSVDVARSVICRMEQGKSGGLVEDSRPRRGSSGRGPPHLRLPRGGAADLRRGARQDRRGRPRAQTSTLASNVGVARSRRAAGRTTSGSTMGRTPCSSRWSRASAPSKRSFGNAPRSVPRSPRRSTRAAALTWCWSCRRPATTAC